MYSRKEILAKNVLCFRFPEKKKKRKRREGKRRKEKTGKGTEIIERGTP